MDPVVILATDSVSAGPGGEARLQARVRNQGRRVESYVVEVLGEPSRFCQVEPRNVSVLPGKEADVTITFRPPVGATTPTGSLPFAVRAVSEVGSSSSAVAEGRLELAGAAGLQAWADATTDAGRWSASYRLVFANQGNAPARLFVAAHDPASAVRLTVRDEILSVPPGAQVDTEIRVKARQPFLRGSTVNRIITASCQDFPFGADRPAPGQVAPKDDPHHRTFQLTFQQKPILSKLTLALVALALVAAVGLVLLQLRGGNDVVLGMARPATPLGFQATPQGSTAIFLSWDRVPNAAGYDIRRTTPEGQLSGPVEVHVDASTLSQPIEGLGPSEQHCFAVVATGPEDVDPSPPSQHACASTDPTPTLDAPVNFVATPESPGVFRLTWEHPSPEGVTFTVYVDAAPAKPDIAALSTSLELEVKDLSYVAPLTVRAVLGEQQSNFSNEQVVTVDAKPVVVTTTIAGPVGTGGPGGPGGPGGTPTTVAGTPTTVAGSATTTPTTAPTTTLVTTPARGELRSIEERWAARFDVVQPVPVGPGEETQRARIAADFGVAPDQVLTLSNRDTQVRLAAGAPDTEVRLAPPSDEFFYVAQLDEATATQLCSIDTRRCKPRVVEGAANAAVRTNIVVLDRIDPETPLGEVDEAIAERRVELGHFDIYVLDGATRDQFGTDELIVYASGFTDDANRTAFCSAARLSSCEPVLLEPAR